MTPDTSGSLSDEWDLEVIETDEWLLRVKAWRTGSTDPDQHEAERWH
jgi:hypothetical protein